MTSIIFFWKPLLLKHIFAALNKKDEIKGQGYNEELNIVKMFNINVFYAFKLVDA